MTKRLTIDDYRNILKAFNMFWVTMISQYDSMALSEYIKNRSTIKAAFIAGYKEALKSDN